MTDILLQLAFAMYNTPGAFGLLLGSGISRPAEIPTGWDIVIDLIEQIAVASGAGTPSDPISWYTEQYSVEPRYDDLLERLGTRSSERNAILRRYFEVTPEQRRDNPAIKRPTVAHKAIAMLVQGGYIRVVITTNFDQLLEQALEHLGITPVVVYGEERLRSARPPQHSLITIYKVHGDYLSEDFRNTPLELEVYSPIWKEHLKQIFQQYGMIVSGWSADWDVALRNAVLSPERRHYSSYWCSYGEPSAIASDVIQSITAQSIVGMPADVLFQELHRMVEALEMHNKRQSLPAKVALERVKRLIPDEAGYLELEELFRVFTEKAYQAFNAVEFYTRRTEIIRSNSQKVSSNPTRWRENLELYFSVCEPILNMIAALCWYGKATQKSHLTIIARRWFDISSENPTPYISENYFPLLLFMYVSGIVALHRENWDFTTQIWSNELVINGEFPYTNRSITRTKKILDMTVAEYRDNQGDLAAIGIILRELIEPILKPYFLSQVDYEKAFDLFEMFNTFEFFVQTYREEVQTGVLLPQVKRCHDAMSLHPSLVYMVDFWKKAGSEGMDWIPLQLGFFGGDIETLERYLSAYTQAVGNETRGFCSSVNHIAAYRASRDEATIGSAE